MKYSNQIQVNAGAKAASFFNSRDFNSDLKNKDLRKVGYQISDNRLFRFFGLVYN